MLECTKATDIVWVWPPGTVGQQDSIFRTDAKARFSIPNHLAEVKILSPPNTIRMRGIATQPIDIAAIVSI
jgi:hypothetical protein